MPNSPTHSRTFRLLLSLLIAAVLWQVVALTVGALRGVPFPTPLQTVARLLVLLRGKPLADHTLYHHIGDSLLRWGVAFAIAGMAGVAYGLFAGHGGLRRDLTFPLVHALQLIPGLAWIPVALLLFGIHQRTTVFIIAVTAFPPIAINVAAGVKAVDTTYLRAARMLGAR